MQAGLGREQGWQALTWLMQISRSCWGCWMQQVCSTMAFSRSPQISCRLLTSSCSWWSFPFRPLPSVALSFPWAAPQTHTSLTQTVRTEAMGQHHVLASAHTSDYMATMECTGLGDGTWGQSPCLLCWAPSHQRVSLRTRWSVAAQLRPLYPSPWAPNYTRGHTEQLSCVKALARVGARTEGAARPVSTPS